MCARASKTKAAGPASLPAASIQLHLGRLYKNNVLAYRRELTACRRRMSRDAVHRLRVAIRRLLACLELLAAARLEGPAMRGLLQRQLKPLGNLHDTKIQLQRIKDAPRVSAGLQPLRRHLRKRKDRQEKAARKMLSPDKTVPRLKQWRPGHAPANAGLIPRLRRLIDGKLQQAFDPLAAFSPSMPVDSVVRHRSRMISREYRYIMEALRPGWRGGETDRLLSTLRAQQKIIGQIHDRELLLRRIDRLIAEEKLSAAAVRPFRTLLQSEKTKLLKDCPQLDRRVFLGAMLARRDLRQNLSCN